MRDLILLSGAFPMKQPLLSIIGLVNLGRTRVRGDERQAMIFSPTEKRGFHDTDKFGKLYIRNPRLEKQRTGK